MDDSKTALNWGGSFNCCPVHNLCPESIAGDTQLAGSAWALITGTGTACERGTSASAVAALASLVTRAAASAERLIVTSLSANTKRRHLICPTRDHAVSTGKTSYSRRLDVVESSNLISNISHARYESSTIVYTMNSGNNSTTT